MLVIFKKSDSTAEQTIDVSPDSKLGESREAAQMLLGLPENPPCKLVLERTDKELKDNLTFEEAGIQDNDKLILSSSSQPEIKPLQDMTSPFLNPPTPFALDTSTSSTSNNWRIAVITGGVIGIFLLAGLFFTNSKNNSSNPSDLPISSPITTQEPSIPDTTLTPTPTSESIVQQKAINLIQRWLDAKKVMFAPPYNRQIAAELTTGEQYEKAAGSDGSINWLQNNDAYYRYGVQKIDGVDNFVLNGEKATIQVRVTEDSTLYKNGNIDRESSAFKTLTVVYNLELVNGDWKISSSKVAK
jgi:hypothetical protein